MHEEQNLMSLILESNLLNFVLVALALIWVIAKFLPKAAKETRAKLEAELKEAKEARLNAEKKLNELSEKIANSEEESKSIVIEAEKTAKQLKEDLIIDAKEHIDRMQDLAEKDIEMKKNLALQSIKEMATKAAIQLTEESVKNASKDEAVLRKIQDKFLKELTTVE